MSQHALADLLRQLRLDQVDPALLAVAGGVLLLLAGRRLYWLLTGLAGFVGGYLFFVRAVEVEPGPLALILGVAAGVLAAVVVVFFQKLAVAAIGFLAGGLAMISLAASQQWAAGLWILLAAVAAGVAGALVARTLFEGALIVMTSIAGAALVLMGLELAPAGERVAMLVLVLAGSLFQLLAGRAERRKKRSG